jgi:L-alanine-DL-glutamate epimerase-like enolase superfamily enzyme
MTISSPPLAEQLLGVRDRIADVAAFPIAYPEPNDFGRTRRLVIVRVETEGGAVGWGEAVTRAPEAGAAVKLVVERALGDVLRGRDPRDVRGCWDALHARARCYLPGGIGSYAISALDIALWDLAGQLAELPVHRLLGDRMVEQVEACASMIWDPADVEWTVEQVRSAVAAGYRAVKCGWGRTPETSFGCDAARDVRIVQAVREAIGEEIAFAADVATGPAGWSAAHAVQMARELEAYRLAWLEDALPHEDASAWARLHAGTSLQLATGELGWTPLDYEPLLASPAVDVVLVDPGRAEGITGMLAVIDAAVARGVRYVPHSWSSAINTAAALHVFAARPGGVVFELMPRESPAHDELCANPVVQRDGRIEVPDEPGLGCWVNEDMLRGYADAL